MKTNLGLREDFSYFIVYNRSFLLNNDVQISADFFGEEIVDFRMARHR